MKDSIKVGNLNEDTKLDRTFLHGSKRKAVILESCTIGKGEYKPGWKWSEHAGKITGKKSEAHIGYIVSGEMMIRRPNGKEVKIKPGECFEIQPNHDV